MIKKKSAKQRIQEGDPLIQRTKSSKIQRIMRLHQRSMLQMLMSQVLQLLREDKRKSCEQFRSLTPHLNNYNNFLL